MLKKICFFIFFLFIVGAFFVPIPRSEEEMTDFIVKSQIEYPLPDETVGKPTSVQDKTGLRKESLLRSTGEFTEKQLKIIKVNDEFYWDSWKGQKLKVIRGKYYITDQPLASTTFISENNDGMILIYNGTISSLGLCGAFGNNDMRSSRYIETRLSFDGDVVVIKGKTRLFYPHGFSESLCTESNAMYPWDVIFKPSLYEWFKAKLLEP